MIDVAVALTRSSAAMDASAIARLRAHAFDDVAIHQIVQITALFNYYNRVVGGLGADHEPEWGGDPRAPGRGRIE